jgi:hypothetical protein
MKTLRDLEFEYPSGNVYCKLYVSIWILMIDVWRLTDPPTKGVLSYLEKRNISNPVLHPEVRTHYEIRGSHDGSYKTYYAVRCVAV